MSNATINPNNWYHINRASIYKLAMERGVDTYTACAMYRHEQGVGDPDGVADGIDTEISEFCAYVDALQEQVKRGQVDCNAVKHYFIGC